MSDYYYAILTDVGAADEAAAIANKTAVKITQFAAGDSNGHPMQPDTAQTALVHERYRGVISETRASGNEIVFTLDIPPDAPEFVLNEYGIYTDTGDLFAVGWMPDINKVADTSGAAMSVTILFALKVNSTDNITVVVYDQYITPDEADQTYLRRDKQLSEIRDQGAEKQGEARENIGIDGEIAYQDKQNNFTKANTFGSTVAFNGPSTFNNTAAFKKSTTFEDAVSFSKNITLINDASFVVPDVNSFTITVGSAKKIVWNTGNLNPVKTVNNRGPDANGNVTVSIPGSGVLNVRLGAEASSSYAGGSVMRAPSGCVLVGLQEEQGDNEIHLYLFRPIQQDFGSGYVTVLQV